MKTRVEAPYLVLSGFFWLCCAQLKPHGLLSQGLLQRVPVVVEMRPHPALMTFSPLHCRSWSWLQLVFGSLHVQIVFCHFHAAPSLPDRSKSEINNFSMKAARGSQFRIHALNFQTITPVVWWLMRNNAALIGNGAGRWVVGGIFHNDNDDNDNDMHVHDSMRPPVPKSAAQLKTHRKRNAGRVQNVGLNSSLNNRCGHQCLLYSP